jgi:hypothetical protein
MCDLTNVVTAMSSIVIACATVATWRVYQRMSKQIANQIDLTQTIFLETHRPVLSVTLEGCKYSEMKQTFEAQIVVTNHGTAVANDVNLRVSFGGSNAIKDINRIVIQPQNKIVQTFCVPTTPDEYKVGQMVGNRFNVLIEGSYRGIADRDYRYRERHDYDPDLKSFVPVMNW